MEQFPIVISTASIAITRSLGMLILSHVVYFVPCEYLKSNNYPLVQLNPILSAETERSVKAEFPPCPEWKAVHLYPKVLEVVASVSGSVLVGPELCRRPEYLDNAKAYGVDLLLAALHIKNYPAPLKAFVAMFSEPFKTIRRERKELAEFLAPIIREREEAMARGEKPSPDALSAVIKDCRQRRFKGVEPIVNVQLFLTFNTIQTTAAGVTRM